MNVSLKRKYLLCTAKKMSKNKLLLLTGTFAAIALAFVLIKPLVSQHHTRTSKMLAYTHNGGDIRHAGQMIDFMYDNLVDREELIGNQCEKLHMKKSERAKLIFATRDAGYAAIAKVRASNYTIAYQPNYPPLPQ